MRSIHTIGTTNHPCVGKRVEIPVGADMWMRGARFGVVTRVIECVGEARRDIFRVRLDHPQARKKLRGYWADNCRILEG